MYLLEARKDDAMVALVVSVNEPVAEDSDEEDELEGSPPTISIY